MHLKFEISLKVKCDKKLFGFLRHFFLLLIFLSIIAQEEITLIYSPETELIQLLIGAYSILVLTLGPLPSPHVFDPKLTTPS